MQRQSNQSQPPKPRPDEPSSLDGGLVGDRSQGLGSVLLEGDRSCLTGQGGLSLDLDGGTLGLGLGLEDGVLLHSADEVLTGSGLADVLDTEVDALLDVPVADLLVDDDTDRGLGDVVHDTGLSVVDLVGHTVFKMSGFRDPVSVCWIFFVCIDLPLLDGTVGLDVDDVTDPV